MDGRTTIMIRNIPNKYTQGMLLDLFEIRHKKKFDFFYLPIDYTVNIFLFRITATSVMLFSTLSAPSSLQIFIEIFILKIGLSLIQIRSAKSATLGFKELHNSKTILSTLMWFNKRRRNSDLSLEWDHSINKIFLISFSN